MTDELVHNATHGYMQILKEIVPSLSLVAVDAPRQVPARAARSGVGTGFSAGIDSFAVLADHHFSGTVPQALRLTHLTYFNVGSHGWGQTGRSMFEARHARLAPVVRRLGLPFVKVDSNVDDFYPYWDFGYFGQTHVPRTMSAAILLQGGIGRYFMASSVDYAHAGVRPSTDMAISDSIALPLLATSAFRAATHGSQYSRIQKTAMVALVRESRDSLDVCVSPLADGRNCSRCYKCLRTQLALDLLGQLNHYRGVFESTAYLRARATYLDEVATSHDPLIAELRHLAQDVGLRLPHEATATVRQRGRVIRRRARTLRTRVVRAVNKRRRSS